MKRVAVLVESNRQYARGLLKGIGAFALECGEWSIRFEFRDLRSPLPTWLNAHEIDGALVRVETQQQAKALKKLKLPVLDLRGAIPDSGIPFMGIDNTIVARRVAEHLRSHGLQHFAFYGRPVGEYRFWDQRCADFVREVESGGHSCHVFDHSNAGDPKRQALQWLQSLPKPIGIMTPHDEFGHQLMQLCNEANLKVPGQVAIASVDNDELICNMGTPTLTSLDIRSEYIGRQAANLLHQAMMGELQLKAGGFTEIEPGDIVVRDSTQLAGVSDPATQKALIFIRDHVSEGISVRELLDHVGCSQRSLERKLKEAIGLTPHQEIMRVRIDLARKLIRTSKLSLQEVSYRCGFSSYKYFSDAFLKATQQRPSDYAAQG